MEAASKLIIFQDIFMVDELIKEKYFDEVTRIVANKSEIYDMFMQVDVNTEIYPMRVGDRFTMALAYTLNLDGSADTGYYNLLEKEKISLADSYEYVMRGKLYKILEERKGTPSSNESARKVIELEINVSFGGLLMMLKGNPSLLSRFELDEYLYLLIKKL